MKKPEILAPAGSMDALKAAVYAGADAVYLGGSKFGARAYADNFDGDNLVKAIEYAHLYGVKVYLTINTLFRDEEISLLYDYLIGPYEAGLDAVIVQDLGVMKYVHEQFPLLPIHASTQMTITTSHAYSLLQNYGVTRIVPARELSITEIASLKKTFDRKQTSTNASVPESEGVGIPEIEVFVQGALCYCYSGQCLMSSMLGGRSGNRGRCAQPCRLPYELWNEAENNLLSKVSYTLSPKDLCGLDSIPDLIKAGVDSFKIEGRMKKPEYVSACVRAYRKCVDAWFADLFQASLVEECRQQMAEVFNRGGFTKGYYKQHNGRDMMSTKNPGNIGVCIGSIHNIQKNKITLLLKHDVNPGDVIMFDGDQTEISLTCNIFGKANQQIILNAPRTNVLKKGQKAMRMQNAKLMKELQNCIFEEKKIHLSGFLYMHCNEKAQLTLEVDLNGERHKITEYGDVVETALSKSLTTQVIRDKISATGNTRYQLNDLKMELDSDIFYSAKALKELRRNAIVSLETYILNKSRRLNQEKLLDFFNLNQVFVKRHDLEWNKDGLTVLVSNLVQYKTVCEYKKITTIYLDLQYFAFEDVLRILNEGKGNIYIVLPAVIRNQYENEIIDLIEQIMAKNINCTGIVVRNIDEFALLYNLEYDGNIVTDYSLYTMNRFAYAWIREQMPKAHITIPVELNAKQINELSEEFVNSDWIVYGYQQLMVSAQCVQNTTMKCNHSNAKMVLHDRYKKSFRVNCICKYCYNLIYNGIPTVLFDLKSSTQHRHNHRVQFIWEDTKQVKEVLDSYFMDKTPSIELTRGHYKRGVE